MKSGTASLFLTLLLMTILTACISAPSRIQLASPWLDSDALTRLFRDHTVESVNVKSGVVSRTYYAPDGSLVQWREGTWRNGRWRVRNGRICLQMEDRREKCRAVIKEDGQYRKYVIRRDGRHRLVVTYRWFEPGNRLRQP
ncbi:MAG TPA: hypothetical protein ENI96_06405 [Sedimenticola thiotaurini]|uniref:Lipoprotein n=1 Tax=Sedimenticola thiotaurini TaxID=1543721 RepID=A0A831RIV1_9GAMM|nr:hypothetical protein [Sedimenticola thiotaurini]